MREYLSHLKPPDRKTGLILVLTAVLPVMYVYNGIPSFWLHSVAPALGLGSHPMADLHAQWYRFGSVFLLFAAVPAIACRLLLCEGPASFGFVTGDWRFGLKALTVALIVAVPFLYVSAGQAGFQAEYPMAKSVTGDPGLFVLYELTYVFYYIGWETLFRGYMLFGLKKRYGSFGAIMFQAFPSILIHIGKPVGETWGAVVAAFALGAFALRTRSVLYVFAFHYAIGVLMDVFCAMRAGSIGG